MLSLGETQAKKALQSEKRLYFSWSIVNANILFTCLKCFFIWSIIDKFNSSDDDRDGALVWSEFLTLSATEIVDTLLDEDITYAVSLLHICSLCGQEADVTKVFSVLDWDNHSFMRVEEARHHINNFIKLRPEREMLAQNMTLTFLLINKCSAMT